MDLGLVLFIIGFGLLVIGTLYAVIIYFWPIDRTWAEVVIGVGLTIGGEMLATACVLLHYGVWSKFWWIILFPLAAFILTGVPMAGLQEIKVRRQRRRGERVEKKFNGDLDD